MRTAPLLAAVALLATAATAGAQLDEDPSDLSRPIRGLAGGSFYYAHPVGEFSDYIRRGFGGNLHGTWLVSDDGVLGLRFDASYMNYGRETVQDVCALPSNCRVYVDVTTTNNIAFFGAGPQIIAPRGPLRPYVAGQVGWTFIWTSSSIEDADDYDDRSIYDTDNVSDNTFSYGGLGGVLIPISGGRNPASLDLGVRYLRNGRVHYLREGDIIDDPYGGPPMFNIQRSRADLLTYFIGVTVALR
jgi:hypothetical protein